METLELRLREVGTPLSSNDVSALASLSLLMSEIKEASKSAHYTLNNSLLLILSLVLALLHGSHVKGFSCALRIQTKTGLVMEAEILEDLDSSPVTSLLQDFALVILSGYGRTACKEARSHIHKCKGGGEQDITPSTHDGFPLCWKGLDKSAAGAVRSSTLRAKPQHWGICWRGLPLALSVAKRNW